MDSPQYRVPPLQVDSGGSEDSPVHTPLCVDSDGPGNSIVLLPFCGTEGQRKACMEWQGEGPDPWLVLRRSQHEFLETKLKALIEKVDSGGSEDSPVHTPLCVDSDGPGNSIVLLPFCGTEGQRKACMEWQGEGPDPWLALRRSQHEFLETKLKALIEKVDSGGSKDSPVHTPLCVYSDGPGNSIGLLPFCGTEGLRKACMEKQGEEPDPWLALRRSQHEFLETKLKALIEKCQEAQGEGCVPALLTESPEHKDTGLSSSLIHPPTVINPPIYPRFRPVLVPIEEADASDRLDFEEEFKPGPAAQCDDVLKDLALDEGRQDFDVQKEMLETAPKIQGQEALREDLMTTCQPEFSEQGSRLLSSTNEDHGGSSPHPPTTMKTLNGPHFKPVRRVLVLVEEADSSHRLDCHEFKPVSAAQSGDDLENGVEVLFLEETNRQNCDGQSETLDPAPKKRGWIRRLLSHFQKKKQDNEKAKKKQAIEALQTELQQLKEDKKIVKEIYRQEKKELKQKLKDAKKEWRLEKKRQKERQKDAKEGMDKCSIS